MAVLVAHRLFAVKTPVARRAKTYLIDNFGINVNTYDLITGYRADDSYFDEVAEKYTYYVLRKERDDNANQAYLRILEGEADGLFIQDIIREGVTNDDLRIPRNKFE